jgi:antitoxin YefM
MKAIPYAAARNKLAETMHEVCRDRMPVVIKRGRTDSVVMVSLADFTSMEETAYLLRSPANARRLARARRDLGQGRGIKVSPKVIA